MRTTIELPDELMKKAKKRAVDEGITLKELFTRSLQHELSDSDTGSTAPWEKLRGSGKADSLAPEDSGFEGYTGPDWNHSV